MTAGGEVPRSLVDRAIDATVRRSVIAVAAGALAVGIAVVALLGGFQRAEPVAEELESLSLGGWSGTQPLSVAVTVAFLTDTVGYSEAEPGTEYLVVEVEFLNTWTAGSARAWNTLELVTVAGESSPPSRTIVAADGVDSGELPPRVPTPMLLVWEVPSGAIAGEAQLSVIDAELETEGRLITTDYWRDLGPVATVLVPVSAEPHGWSDEEDGT